MDKTLLHRRSLHVCGLAAALLGLNVYFSLNLFSTAYTSHMESIEAAYMGISRYIAQYGFHLDWFPQWYTGIPFQNSYPPLLHVLVAIPIWLAGFSPGLAHHAVCALLYCLGAVAVYFLALRLTRHLPLSFAAGLVYSLVSPSAFVSTSVQSWTPSHWDPARFYALVKFGDGPHVAAVALLPLALLALDWALENTRPIPFFVAALACAAVVLTNWLGAFALALAVFSYLLARGLHEPAWLRLVLRTAAIAIAAYLLAMPCIPPSTLDRIRYNAQYVIGSYPMTARQLAIGIALVPVVVFIAWLLRRLRASVLTGFALLFSFFTTLLFVLDERFQVALVPQPHRYHHEVDLGLCLLVVCLGAFIMRRAKQDYVIVALCLLAVCTLIQVRHVRRTARNVVGPIDIGKTVEYELSTWLRDHLHPGRVFISGSTQFWLTVFTDTPQVGGGFGQGTVNAQIPIVHYGIPWTGNDGPDTVNWLKLYGATAVVTAEANSRDAYREVWRDPLKFKGVLPELFRDGGDVIYAVPQRSTSLAYVIPRHAIVQRSPVNNVDFDPVKPLLTALDDATLPVPTVTWSGPSHGVISTAIAPGQSVFVQVTYHRGWHATANHQPAPIQRDGLGFMVVDPHCAGPCEIHLDYDGGTEMHLAQLASASTAAFLLLLWPLYRRFSRNAWRS